MRLWFKAFAVTSVVTGFTFWGHVARWLSFGKASNQTYARILAFHTKACLFLMGIRVTHKGDKTPPRGLLVCNHVSYVDVLVLASWYPCLFLTSTDIEKDPILGTICRAANCIFADRNTTAKIKQDIREIRKRLASETPLVIFPEGTSTDGAQLYPFKSSLLSGAAGTGLPVRPLCLNYLTADGETIGRHRDSVFWYGDMTFFSHFLRLLSLREIRAELTVLPTINTENLHRKDITSKAHDAIRQVHIPVPASV